VIRRLGPTLFALLALEPSVRGDDARPSRRISQAQVQKVIRSHLGELEACYRRERKRLETPAGRIDLHWEFREKGRVVTAEATVDTLGSPELRQCLTSAVRRWRFPPVALGWVSVNMPFAFGPSDVSFGKEAEAISTVPRLERPRALLLRFGPELVSIVCVAGQRSFLGRVCDTPINRSPQVGLDLRYTSDSTSARVHPALVRFEFDQVDAVGFSLGGWPLPPADARKDSGAFDGAFDGFAVWPPGAFAVHLTTYGEEVVHDGVRWNCEDRPWSPCRDDDRSSDGGVAARTPDRTWPLVEGALARDAERVLAPILSRFTEARRLRLIQTLSVDLDGDGKEEKLYNLAVTDVELRPPKPGDEDLDHDTSTVFFFILIEHEGRVSRLPVATDPSQLDGMDGAVLGWLDIDGDGRPELALETPGFELHTWQLVRFRDGAFRPVAEFGFYYMGQIADKR
jgi:hypothetical protein